MRCLFAKLARIRRRRRRASRRRALPGSQRAALLGIDDRHRNMREAAGQAGRDAVAAIDDVITLVAPQDHAHRREAHALQHEFGILSDAFEAGRPLVAGRIPAARPTPSGLSLKLVFDRRMGKFPKSRHDLD